MEGGIIERNRTMTYSPLEQFEVYPLVPLRRGGVDLSFTNASLLRVLAVSLLVIVGLLLTVNGGGYRRPSRAQVIAEAVYGVALSRVAPRGAKAQGYFPFIYCLFTFILALNRLGLVPYSFTVTSHLIVTLTLTGRVWIGKLQIGLRLHGIKLLGRFLPAGAPLPRLLRLVPIEIRGFVITLISLSVRLFANRRAGHILLKVRAGFAWTRLRAGGVVTVASLLPAVVLFRLLGLETGVARVQAYVFSLLSARYIGDVLEGGH